MSKITKILLIVMVVGLIFGGIGAADAIKVWKGDITDTKEIDVGKLEKNGLYEGEITGCYDIIAEETTTRTYGGIPTSKTKSPYYLVNNGNCYFVINVTVKDQQSDFDKMADQTWDYIDEKTDDMPTPVKVSAQAVDMPDKVKEFLKEYCDEWGLSDQDYAEMVENTCCLKTTKYDVMKYTPIIGFGAALLCAVILIIRKASAPKIVNL